MSVVVNNVDHYSALSSMEEVINLAPLLTAAWLAVLTAAISFWRIRSKTTTRPVSSSSIPPPNKLETTPFCKPTVCNTPLVKTTSLSEGEGMLTRGNSGKEVMFAAYYGDDDVEEREYEEEGGGVDGEDEDEVVVRKWTVEMMTRSGAGRDLGWYGYQDRKVIDGSVVRLWDYHEERESSSPRSCRRISRCPSCVGVVTIPFVLT